MEIVTFNEAKRELGTVLNRVVDDADYTVVTRHDAEDVVIMSRQYFDSLMETLYLLKSPANAANLRESIAQYRAGLVTPKKLIEE
ncbi:type II toxin-antitoxin system Phd/YefM family antitoxin [cf. Phormidesmis sp. LEGE 11477]|uniref:type II toxin-antitoxin system Phd/YefM family antitoxin n=1 Tax=cf. Phormidesmis sp. LEGE 11477 TaxID=1828680 RepID=UPI0018816B9C|nr:type II toxin-antitoxin system prevent-host-death family antitoxin [cf. Phormidesmis sp. LEGE 11477]MBE9060842.1 type II toxin-antitoxin system prevent-host-death family antitoxin [cf. Phormidesmis sp. LEGE 11477]